MAVIAALRLRFPDEVNGASGLVFFERPPSFNNQTGVEAYVMNMYTLWIYRQRRRDESAAGIKD